MNYALSTKKIKDLAIQVKAVSQKMSMLSTAAKNTALVALASSLKDKQKQILAANAKDLYNARKRGLSEALIDRLTLTPARIDKMSQSLNLMADLKDPVGEVIKRWTVASGLKIEKVRVPIGVILIIYESRPDVTADCIGLCLKAGNCVILKGGSEAINSNNAIFKVFSVVLNKISFPKGVINFIASTDHRTLNLLLKLNDYIDLVIPRGGEGLIQKIIRLSRIPIIKHYKGVCHVYVDRAADLEMAKKICFNAKVQRPGTCNAMESLLVNQAIAETFLPSMVKQFNLAGVEIRGCAKTLKIIKNETLNQRLIKKAKGDDYYREYLDLILSLRIVKDVSEAIRHIGKYGSHHSDAIITNDAVTAAAFLNQIDSACVYHNASTRFTDGFQFGMGGEIGISTDRIHARGPMALEELTTYKYVVHGSGQIRQS